MKKQILSRGAMTLICSAILAACGSSGGGSLAIENAPNVPSAAELEQAKQAAANAEQKLSEAQQNLNVANQKLKDAQTSGQTTASELNKVKKELTDAQTALKDAEKNAEAVQRAADAESKLSDAQKALNDANQKLKDAETNGQTTTAELDKVKKELADAKTALKDAEKNAEAAQRAADAESKLSDAQKALNDANQKLKDAETNGQTTTAELDKVKKELADAQAALKEAETAQKKAVEEAKKQAVEDYKKELADTAAAKEKEKEDAKQAEIKTALTSSFGTAENGMMPTKKENYTDYTTSVVSINHQNGTASTATNPEGNTPATKSISINGTKIALLENAGSDKIALQELEKENTALPAGSGWVGSQTSSASWVPFGKMRFGVYNDNAGSSHLFVTGQPAIQRDMDGVAKSVYKYTGSAIIGKDGQYQALPDSISGTVDFHEKNVDLDFAINEQNKHKITGKINGNTFAGESETGVLTKGGFYGYADTLGGFMQINKGEYSGYNGVYGAGQDGRPVKTYP